MELSYRLALWSISGGGRVYYKSEPCVGARMSRAPQRMEKNQALVCSSLHESFTKSGMDMMTQAQIYRDDVDTDVSSRSSSSPSYTKMSKYYDIVCDEAPRLWSSHIAQNKDAMPGSALTISGCYHD